jgi:hypothetical protein
VIKAVQFVTLLLFSLVTGVFWATWFSLSRSMSAITAETFLEVGRLMIANLGGPMGMLLPAALLAALVLSVFLFRGRHTRAGLFASAAFVLMVAALVSVSQHACDHAASCARSSSTARRPLRDVAAHTRLTCLDLKA